MPDVTRRSEELGGFETRLLSELLAVVDERAREARRPRPQAGRRHRRLLAVAVAVAALLAAVTAAARELEWVGGGDARKQEVLAKLDRGEHVGPVVVADDGWSLHAAARPDGTFDWQLVSRSVVVGGVFLGKTPIEASWGSGSVRAPLVGRVNTPRAESVELVRGATAVTVPLHDGFFLVPVGRDDRSAGGAVLVARDARGRPVARLELAAD